MWPVTDIVEVDQVLQRAITTTVFQVISPIQPKLQSSEFTFAPIFWPNFAVSEL